MIFFTEFTHFIMIFFMSNINYPILHLVYIILKINDPPENNAHITLNNALF